MADREEEARWEINPNEPPGFNAEYVSLLELKYEINDKGQYVFKYHSEVVKSADVKFLPERIADRSFETFFDGENYIAEIDMKIKHGDTIVHVETVDNGEFRDLYWSQLKPALKTKKRRDKIYGHLHYWDGANFTTRIPNDKLCRRMYFKANLNKNISTDKKHGFSFNVLIRGKEFEVDPDIRNPSLDERWRPAE